MRVRATVSQPQKGWGSLTDHASIGTVAELNGEAIKVKFPGLQYKWNGIISEMEVVNPEEGGFAKGN